MAGVRTTACDYDTFAPKWKRVRDVVAGQDAMHKAGEAYLPKLKDEDPKDYAARLGRSDFFNGTWRTIDALSGMVGRKPPTVDVPAGIKSYLDDITMSGVTMEGMAKECVEEVLSVGRIGILVDHPPLPDKVAPLTVAVAEQMGQRPTLKLYTAETIRNWKFARINNAWVLSMVVLGEKTMVPKDEFTDEAQDRYRVLDLENGFYRQRLFKVEKEQDVLLEEFYPVMNGKPLSFIPFMPCGAGGKNDCVDEPPLIDLVDKNIAHYQVSADYRHGLHFTGLPTPYVCGWSPPMGPDGKTDKLYIGSTTAWIFTEPQAKVGFLEFTGTGLEAMEKALDRLERQMALLGARMIADETKQVETLGATQIKRQGENSVLSKIVQSVSEALEWALKVFAEWAGVSDVKVVYQLNRDFLPALMDGRELTALVAAVQAGALSEEEFFELMQRGDVIAGDKTFEEHQAQIKAQGPPAPAKPAPGQPQPGEPGAAAA
jgi:hypothetical protein